MAATHIALVLHGGAGPVAGRDYAVTERHLLSLAKTCFDRLRDAGSALDVVEYATAELESCGLYVAGRGSAPNNAGYVELDASIMHGPDRSAGAVAAIRDVVNPVSVARRVMENTPHVMLAADGAVNFARAHGFACVEDPDSYYRLPVGVKAVEFTRQKHGTVGAVALDQAGQIAAATSTGGTFAKLEGRVGDTPLIGAGTWADDRVGISCTGTGEHIIRAGGAQAIAAAVKAGQSLDAAVDDMLGEVKRLGGEAGVIAVDRHAAIVMRYNSAGMKRAAISSDSAPVSKTFD
ncbi:MAG: isoaspartyl peptidase/L-asparaginase [Gammaproteobacteria bacterium]|nr:isoaspartyl peptidase/L-asparaginase [Gammaproteobacteria bacterium]